MSVLMFIVAHKAAERQQGTKFTIFTANLAKNGGTLDPKPRCSSGPSSCLSWQL